MAVKVNYYEILGVTPESNLNTIKSAYRKLARKYHPDLNADNVEEAMKNFKRISEAYETLSNPQKRQQYDIINGIFKTKFTADFNSDYFNKNFKTSSGNSTKTNKKETFEKKPTNNSSKKQFNDTINDIFDEFTKTSKEKYKKEKIIPQKGSDINADVTITLAEVSSGCKKTINILHTQSCPKCHGRKFINGAKCTNCDGKGEISNLKKITVTIPKGIKNNTKLRLKKEGNQGFYGGENGDLYITVTIQSNSRIQYEGNNLLYKLPIEPYEAILGANITVPTFEGNILLKIPPKSSQGQKFRLSGLGLDKNGKIGDMIITLDIEISKDLSDDEIKLYEKLKKLNKRNLRENILYD